MYMLLHHVRQEEKKIIQQLRKISESMEETHQNPKLERELQKKNLLNQVAETKSLMITKASNVLTHGRVRILKKGEFVYNTGSQIKTHSPLRWDTF